MKSTDTLKRRLRQAPRQPLGIALKHTPDDTKLFIPLQRHGSLPTTYLHAFTGREYKALQFRLTRLYNERKTPHGGPYLERPWQQFQSFNARYQPLIYELTEHALIALADGGNRDQYARPITGHYVHRFMTACITASIELACRDLGYRYISQEEILSHPKCPEATRRSENPLAIPALDSTVIPDQLFGYETEGKHFFFALEADRNHETIASEELRHNSYGRKLHAYAQVFAERSYREQWGIPNFKVLTVTTNPAHMQTMMRYLAKSTDDTSRFLFKVQPEFGRDWRVPGILKELFTDPWHTATGTVSIEKPRL